MFKRAIKLIYIYIYQFHSSELSSFILYSMEHKQQNIDILWSIKSTAARLIAIMSIKCT